ncbi:bifunctional 6-phosphofructo-2-kinase/fructose-2,6-bisphosphate 2-phosphatase [Gonapodya prolifera JEL478]|uniref:Bifunctional 6-phosphofructo-2-kinase/fructose-2,6-bisphosphate 2-phosphatase n=1 Tax=Gonapodya prolifera (strain JEL478) TaxID=1344416 RepID=A0A139A6H3_GONPJ|nr:bifunctional 6-phosphofructo-2-kinase/fructose-2,6-bisphosphate 2-phosphatase [Gonapodya prolifera JEL478]|eukprot:KXS12406.1 bifunctional 6-phosphofructo-2-kinase/fructose-2,6-bisphosphate 2-phosphatase [Gonapodya prolifera JEL478]
MALTRHDSSFYTDYLERRNEIGPKLVIFMVGLPARGKSYISHKLRRFLSWMGFRTKIFNVGNRRRVADAATTHDATFFDPNNARARELREQVALDTLEELISWLKSGGKVAIHDATNSTRVRREALIHRVSQEPNISFMFMESICTDPIILETNIRMKLNSPDYRNMDPETAIADFKARTNNYEKAYEPLGDVEEKLDVSYVKVFNVGKKSIAYNVRGYLMSQCVFFLGNMHIADRVIYLTRHGESEYNREGKIGGDPPLTDQGRKFAAALARFAQERHPIAPACAEKSKADATFGGGGGGQLQLWTSKLRRTVETAHFFDEQYEVTTMRFLNEIYSGLCEGMTYDDIKKVYPEEYRTRQANKLIGRYPGGENYMDVIERLRPVVVELERLSTDVLIITHNVVMRTLLAYFTGMDLLEMTLLDVPLHTVYCLKPKPYGVEIAYQRGVVVICITPPSEH